tara:strand:- start:8945 stop:9391 length:447 start_codon:yes stop_codon:yes gene_type:complete
MSQFSKIGERLKLEGKTIWLELPDICPGAALLLKPASQANRPYYNALYRNLTKKQGQAIKGPQATLLMIDENRNDDRKLFPKYIIADWRGIENDAGKKVKFSQELAQDLVLQLEDWLFDEIRTFASAPRNFLADPDEEVGDVKELAKN